MLLCRNIMGAKLTISDPLPAPALHALRSVPGVDAVLVKKGGETILVEYKSRLRGPDARHVVEQLGHYAERPLVVAGESTARARQMLVDAGVDVVDAAGNAHIDRPGILIHVEQPSRGPRTSYGGRLRGKAAVVVQALLLEPEREWKVVDLAKRVDASLAMVHQVLTSLEERELLTATGAGRTRRRKVASAAALLDLLAEDLEDRGVEKLDAYRFAQRSEDLLSDVSNQLRQDGVAHAISGAAAANLLAPHLTSVPTTVVWVARDRPLSDAVGIVRAEPTDRGANLQLMSARDDVPLAFAEEHNGIRLANVFRIYVDSRREPQRGAEQAEHLRREVIGF